MVKIEEIWKRKYIDRIKEQTGLSEQDACGLFEAGMDEHDYTSCPIESADIEISYFGD